MKLIRRTIFIVFCFVVLQSMVLHAQWKSTNGLYGKSVNVLYCLDNRILAGTNEGILYSTDCGLSWDAENTIIGQTNIASFSYNGKILYAAGGEKVFSSTDKGVTWSVENQRVYPNTALYFIHTVESKIFIETGKGIMFSSDGGKTFETRNNGLSSTSIQSITNINNTIFLGTAKGVYKSTNDGIQWEPAGNGVLLGQIRALVTIDSTIYTCSDRVYKSIDQGLTWNNMSNGIPLENSISNLITIDQNLYAFTSSGIYCSIDNAETWVCITKQLSQTYFRSIVKNKNKLIITTSSGLLYESDGNNWLQLNSGLTSKVYNLCKYNNGVLVASSSGVYYVEPATKGWKTTLIGMSEKLIFSVSNIGDKIFAGTNDGLYISTNFGESWVSSNLGFLTTNVIRVLFLSNDKIYAGSQIGELFVSENLGQNWYCIRSSQQGEIARSIYVIGSTILLGTSGNFYGLFGSIYKSINNGNSWEEFHEIFYKTDIYSIAKTNSTICLGTNAGLFVSNDNGLNWKRINKTSINAVFASGNNLIASDKEVSNDYGISWLNYGSGLSAISHFNSITESGMYLFIGTDIGVFAIPSAEILTSINNNNEEIPSNYSLSQNYPNPFNPETTIEYSIPKSEYVTLKIYDLLGREVATLVNEFKQAGIYNSKLITQNYKLPSGVYFYRLQAGSYSETKKLILMK